MTNAVIYARFSSDKQHDTSIEAQERACREYAYAHGYNVVGSYVDQAVSGKTTNRASYQRMMRDLKKGIFNIVLIHKYDRIARNLGDHINLQQKLNEHDVQLIAVAQDFGNGKEGKLMMGIQWILSEYYVDNLTEEVRKGMKEVALKAQHTGGYPPFGYDVVNKKYQINLVEAEYVKRMFQCALEQTGYRDLINEMKEKGITGKRGKPISNSSIYEILRNEKYTGVYTYSLVEEKSRDKRRTKPNAIRIENALPVIIERDTWEKVQKIMDSRRFKGPRGKYRCSGLVYCKCGSKMYACTTKSKGHGYYYYVCEEHCGNPTIKVEVVDKMVDVFLAEIRKPESVQSIADSLNEYYADKEKAMAEFEIERSERVSAKEAEIQALAENMTSGVLTPIVIEILNEKMMQLNAELVQIKTLQPAFDHTGDSIGAWLDSVMKTPEERLPEAVIEKIVVDNDTVVITSKLASIIEKTHNEGCGYSLVAGVQHRQSPQLNLSKLPTILYGKEFIRN